MKPRPAAYLKIGAPQRPMLTCDVCGATEVMVLPMDVTRACQEMAAFHGAHLHNDPLAEVNRVLALVGHGLSICDGPGTALLACLPLVADPVSSQRSAAAARAAWEAAEALPPPWAMLVREPLCEMTWEFFVGYILVQAGVLASVHVLEREWRKRT